jgi:hypothetical protein
MARTHTGGMRHDRSSNSSNITTQERNTGLGRGAVAVLGLAQRLVDHLYGVFKSSEFYLVGEVSKRRFAFVIVAGLGVAPSP